MPSISIQPGHLILIWESGQKLELPYFWLYDNAPENWHPNGQKLTESRHTPLDIKPFAMREIGQDLEIDWGTKKSLYSVDFFRSKLNNQPLGEQVFQPEKPLSNSIGLLTKNQTIPNTSSLTTGLFNLFTFL